MSAFGQQQPTLPDGAKRRRTIISMKAPTDPEGRKRLLQLCVAWFAKASTRDRAEILRLAKKKGGLWGQQQPEITLSR
jgi:hypothetical protein